MGSPWRTLRVEENQEEGEPLTKTEKEEDRRQVDIQDFQREGKFILVRKQELHSSLLCRMLFQYRVLLTSLEGF